MRIGCLQFAPQLGDVNNNLTRADAVLARANPEDLDLLVLPELAFSGYNFRSLQQISPFLEPSGSGITSLWARTIALKYDCVVVAGYPEKVDVSPNWPTSPEYYNSAIVVNGDGETIANYRKSFLYYTDETWALEGNRGFYDGYIPSLGNTSIGICMDINPYKFEAPWHAFEFAFHVLEVESNLVIVTMSWITREDPRRFSRTPGLPDMDALTYWVTRLEPLIRSDNEEEIVVVFCNRAGVEDEAIYAGTSAVIGIKNGEVSVYGLLGRGERELLVVDTSNPPFAKLVYRPEANGMGNKTGELEQSKPDSTSSNPTLGRDSKLPDEALQEFDNTRNKDHDTSGDEASDEGGLPGDDEPLSSTLAPTKDKLSLPSRPSPPLSSSPSSSSSPPLPPPHPEPRSNSRGALSFEQDPLPHPPPSEKSPLSVETEPEVEATIKKPTNNKRHAPSISIPPPPDSAPHSGSVQSPATESINSPAPSAPRATPTAIRPRLIIPQSPSILPSQFTAVSDHPMSAASTKSERSVQSIRSNESEASVQTIRSNPRPPEDSTPYPHSGLPLSGYPSNSFQLGHEKRKYGGHVQIAHTIDGTITPTTPFDDISPAASRWFWRQPGSATFRTPASAGGWTPSTAIGRRPEPFPWPAIRSDVRLPSMTRAGNNERGVRHNTTLQEDRQDSSQTPQSNTSSNRTQWSKSSVGTPKPGSQDDKHPSKPSSPKSRNASRSGIAGFSDSSLSEADMTAVVSQHLEQIFQRAESMGRIPADSNSNDTPVPDRPSSPKSRNCSRSRRDEASDTQYGQQRPPVAPSPSLLERESRAAIIPTPVALDFYRRPLSRGATTLSYYGLSHRDASQQYANHDYDTVVPPWSTSTVRRDAPGSSLRSVSRGRQPKVGDDPSSQRPTSADSTRNQLLHTRVSKRLSREMKAQDADRQSRDKGSQSERRPSRSAQGQMEFERVEVISCPNCPVHGRQSVSSGGSNRGSRPTCGQSSSPLPNAPVLEADASQPEKTVTVTTTTTGSLGETGAVNGRAINDSSPPRKTDSAASRPERKTMFKSTFNPVTPKAMTFRHSDMDTEPIPNLECVEKKSSSGRRGNKEERVQTVELATSSTTA